MCLFQLWFPQSIYPVVGLLGHMVVLFLFFFFLGIYIVLSIVAIINLHSHQQCKKVPKTLSFIEKQNLFGYTATLFIYFLIALAGRSLKATLLKILASFIFMTLYLTHKSILVTPPNYSTCVIIMLTVTQWVKLYTLTEIHTCLYIHTYTHTHTGLHFRWICCYIHQHFFF